jgi:Transglycosylase SLT domain
MDDFNSVDYHINTAADTVGVDKDTLKAFAGAESSFKPSAKTSEPGQTSSGLLGFTQKTWESMVKKYPQYSSILSKGPKDPQASSVAGALHLKDNTDELTKSNLPVTPQTQYASHFLGVEGAKKLLTSATDADATKIFPLAAEKNKTMFYNKDGSPKTVKQLYETISGSVDKYLPKKEEKEGEVTWSKVFSDPKYEKLSPEEKTKVQNNFFDKHIAPNVKNKDELEATRQYFNQKVSGTTEAPTQVQTQKEPGAESVGTPWDWPIKAAESIYQGIADADIFKSREETDLDPEQALKQAEAGATTGGAVGLFGPKALEYAGKGAKVLPLYGAKPIGETIEQLGKTWGRTGKYTRGLAGAVGGATYGVTEEVGKSFGWSPATTFAASTLLSGGTEGLTSLGAKELKTTAKLIGSGYFNSTGGILNNLGNLGKTRKEDFVKEAADAQEKAFGKRILNYTEGVIGNEKQNATKALLFDKHGIPQDYQGPASKYLREEVINPTVTKNVNTGNGFSKTPEFADFQGEINRLVEKGTLSKVQGNDMMKKLTSDVSDNPKTRQEYSQTVDNLIRQWGKGLEKGEVPAGHKAVDTIEQARIREELRKSWNGYLTKLGVGNAERDYRNAYKAEVTAELRDHIDHSLTYLTADGLDKLKPLIKDGTYTKQEVLDGIQSKLANTPVEELVSKFNRLDSKLVGMKLLSAEDMVPFRKRITEINKIMNEGEKRKAMDIFARGFLKQLSYRAGAPIFGVGSEE